MTKPKILFWDIETSLCKYAAFGPNQTYLRHDTLLEDWHILTISYMWDTDKKPTSLAVSKYGKDKTLVKQMAKLLQQADLLVHHNGDKFDIKKFTARLIHHGLPPLPKITTIDTRKEWKKIADSNYAHLDYLAGYLGLEGKHKDVGGLWMRLLKGDMSALLQMSKYNDQDVLVLRNVFNKMKPYIRSFPAIFQGRVCPSCGGKTESRGTYAVRSGLTYQRHQCQSCRAWSRDIVSSGKLTTLRSL